MADQEPKRKAVMEEEASRKKTKGPDVSEDDENGIFEGISKKSLENADRIRGIQRDLDELASRVYAIEQANAGKHKNVAVVRLKGRHSMRLEAERKAAAAAKAHPDPAPNKARSLLEAMDDDKPRSLLQGMDDDKPRSLLQAMDDNTAMLKIIRDQQEAFFQEVLARLPPATKSAGK